MSDTPIQKKTFRKELHIEIKQALTATVPDDKKLSAIEFVIDKLIQLDNEENE